MLRATFAFLALAATCEAYVATGGARSPFVSVARQRCASPQAGLEIFNGIIQGVSDAISDERTGFGALNGKNGFGRKLGFGDQRTVRASHILFSFEDYPDGDGEAMADALKAKIAAREAASAVLRLGVLEKPLIDVQDVLMVVQEDAGVVVDFVIFEASGARRTRLAQPC